VQPTNIIADEDKPLATKNPQAELLWWDYWLGHLSFARLCILALLRTIPQSYLLSRLQNVLDAYMEQCCNDHGEQEELKTKTNFE
jgi:hypothetical protein